MSVIHVERPANYTIMANYHLRDRRLSLRAVGLMSRMLSLPAEWDFTVSGLTTICAEGRDAIRTALKELEEAGYLVREQTRSADGTFSRSDYTLREFPAVEESTQSPPEEAETAPEETPPTAAEPMTENPTSVQPTEINKDKTNKEIIIPPKPPRGRRVREKSACDYAPELFERFWKLYPRGEDKAAARYEWDALRPDDDLLRRMSAALKQQIATDEWQRGIGIPYACRWLSKRRWEAAEKLPPDPGPGEAPESPRLEGDRW